MARTKIKHRSYKNATNPQAESIPEPENLRVEAPAQVVPDITPSDDDSFPVPLIRPPSKAERPPDPPPEIEGPQSPPSPTRPDDVSVSCTPATITSIRATNGHTFPVSDQLSPISPESPVNLSRHSPTPGCSRDSTPVRQPEPQPSTSYYQPSTSYYQPSTSYHKPSTSYHQPSSYDQPSTSYDQPSTSYHQPSTRYDQPSTSYHQPSTRYDQPSTSYDQPSTSYHQPSTSYDQPSTSYHQPSTSYHQPSTSYHQPSTSYQDRDTPSPQPSTSYACDMPSTSYHRPRSPTEPVPGCSRDYYPRPGTSTMIDHTYNSSPSSPVNLSWNSPIPGCSRDSAYQPRPSTSSEPTRTPSPPTGMTIWDTMKENCQQQANAAASYRPRTPDMDAVPVDDIFSPNTQREIRSSIRNLFPNGPPPLPLIKPMRRPKKGDVPYIVDCNKRPRVPSPKCLTVFQGDKYGITSETNVDEDEETNPAKRGRRNPGTPGYSKSKFNAQSDDIATRLKLHEKIDSLLGRGETQEEPVGYVTKKNIPPRKFSPLPSTSTDCETIMKNDKHFSESLDQNSDMEDDDDELPEIVWGSTRKYAEPKSHNVSPIDMNDTNNDSQSDDNALVINEDANNNNYSPVENDYSEIQFDKYIPKEKLVESSDVEIVDPKPAEEPKIVETIDLKDGYVFKPPKPVTPTPAGEVICVEDATNNSENQNDPNGNVIDLLDPTQAWNNAGLVQRANNKMSNATETQPDLVIEVPDAECNHTSQSSSSSALSYPDVEFVNETRTEPSQPNGTEAPQNIFDVQIISCDGESNSRPRSNELLNELHSWFSMLTDSCERRLTPRCRSRSKKNSPNRENRAPTVNNFSNPTPECSTQPAPAAEPEPSNGKNLGDCPICLDSLSASLLASTNCGHVFCLECIKKSLSTTGKKCPTCRKQLKGVGYHQVFL